MRLRARVTFTINIARSTPGVGEPHGAPDIDEKSTALVERADPYTIGFTAQPGRLVDDGQVIQP